MKDLREDIKTAAEKLPTKFGAKRELRALISHLWEDETVLALTSGFYEHGNGLLTLTNRRILFTIDGIMKSKNEDFPLDRITSISYQSGLLLGKVIVHSAGNKAEISNVGKPDGKAFVDHARALMSGDLPQAGNAPDAPAATPQPASDRSVADQLRDLKALLDDGIITETEYQAKRTQLIGQL